MATTLWHIILVNRRIWGKLFKCLFVCPSLSNGGRIFLFPSWILLQPCTCVCVGVCGNGEIATCNSEERGRWWGRPQQLNKALESCVQIMWYLPEFHGTVFFPRSAYSKHLFTEHTLCTKRCAIVLCGISLSLYNSPTYVMWFCWDCLPQPWYLNTRSPVGGTLWGCCEHLGGEALLLEVYH